MISCAKSLLQIKINATDIQTAITGFFNLVCHFNKCMGCWIVVSKTKLKWVKNVVLFQKRIKSVMDQFINYFTNILCRFLYFFSLCDIRNEVVFLLLEHSSSRGVKLKKHVKNVTFWHLNPYYKRPENSIFCITAKK